MGKKSGENLRKSSAHNRGLVLQLAATGEAVTRIELARQTGLTKMTISNIVSEFLEKGLLEECEEKLTQNCGRNPICLKVSGLAPKIVGLLIFRSRLETVLCDLRLQILRRARWDFNELDRESLISRSCDLIDQVSAGEERILGIGVASIGPVNMKEGMILNPPRFFGISHVPVVEELRKRYPWPVCLDHDSNSAAQAEKLFGVGKKVQDFLFLEVTDGIGSGIVSNGEVIHNSRGYAPEIGHISIHGDGELCSCGNRGCLELYADANVVSGRLCRELGIRADFEKLCRMWERKEVDTALRKMMEDLSVALVSAVNLLQPELIVLGYEAVYLPERYVGYLEELVNQRKFIRDGQRTVVKKAYFGADAQLVGAAANILTRVFSGKILV